MKSWLDEAEDWISNLEDKVENTQSEQEKEKRLKKNEKGLRELWVNMKHNNIHILGTPAEESEQWIENLFEEIMTEHFPNLMKEKVTQVQEAQRVPIKMNPKKPTPRHIVIKMS